MRWTRGGGRSSNIEDRRGARAGGFGGLGGLPIGARGGGVMGIVLILIVSVLGRSCVGGGGDSASGGFDVNDLLGQFTTASGATGESPIDEASDPEADQVEFVSFVLDDVQGFWDGYF